MPPPGTPQTPAGCCRSAHAAVVAFLLQEGRCPPRHYAPTLDAHSVFQHINESVREACGSAAGEKKKSSSDLPGVTVDEEALRAPLFSAPSLDILTSFLAAVLLSCSESAKRMNIPQMTSHSASPYNVLMIYSLLNHTNIHNTTGKNHTVTAPHTY